MTEETDKERIIGLLEVNDLNIFYNRLNEVLQNKKKQKNMTNSEYKLEFNTDKQVENEITNNIYEYKITSTTETSWKRKSRFIIQKKFVDIKEHTIILIEYKNNQYYFEKNGSINIDKLFEIYNFIRFNKSFNIRTTQVNKLFKEIDKYILNQEKNKILKFIPKDFKARVIDFFENKKLTFDYTIELFNDLKNNRNYENNLDPYVASECIEIYKNGKPFHTEKKYNKNISDKYPEYINLENEENKVNRCEIADLYNEKTNKLYHNKKTNGLSKLSHQIITSCLLIKQNSVEFIDFVQKHNIELDSLSLVFGIINKSNNFFEEQTKSSIGLACYILNENKIPYECTFIDYNNDIKN